MRMARFRREQRSGELGKLVAELVWEGAAGAGRVGRQLQVPGRVGVHHHQVAPKWPKKLLDHSWALWWGWGVS